jgi:hypothetical protein
LWAAWLLLGVLLALPPGFSGEGQRAGPALFRADPALLGSVVVASCSGNSPLSNSCSRGVDEGACGTGSCGPDVAPGLGFTGSVSGTVWGLDSPGGAQRYVRWTCGYVAGSKVNVGPVQAGSCGGESNAAYECQRDPVTWDVVCGYVMWPPFSLAGSAGQDLGVGPAGAWTVNLVRTTPS